MTEVQLMADLIQLRRDTAANWTSANPRLLQGEQGYETDTGKMKIGDGSTAWTGLDYFVDSSAYATSSDITSAVSTKANTADLATVATSGSYNDLSDQPTVPADVSDLTDATSLLGGGGGGGSFDAVASGTLSDGSTVVVNSDGTVSVVAEEGVTAGPGTPAAFESVNVTYTSATFDSANNKVVVAYRNFSTNEGTAIVGTVSGKSISFGTPVVYESGITNYVSTTFDSNSNKVVIAYQDVGNSGYGTAVVGTVSGTSISFGTPVVFQSNSVNNFSPTFDSNSNKIVIAYRYDANAGGYGYAIVGTVSGTSISFGSPVTFASSSTYIPSATFDSNSNKVVIAYKDTGNSSYGTAVVGTVSSTTISFGTPVVFFAAKTSYISTIFDSNANKVVIAYQDDDNGNDGRAIVGTVSGTSISFGTNTRFTDDSSFYHAATFDSANNKVIVAYRSSTDSGYGYVSVGTVSGTSISFDTQALFVTSAIGGITTITFDSANNKVVIPYSDSGNSSYGTAVVYQSVDSTNTNLTSGNYIGISDGAYSDTDTATVQIVGSVDDAQSGLTPGQKYYVQTDGSLATTADDPSVFAGTAVSTTKLIVKG